MKLYLMFLVFLLSSFHIHEAKGTTRLGRALILSLNKYEDIIKISSVGSNQDQELVGRIDELPSVSTTFIKNRRLFSKVVTKNSHDDHGHWLPTIHEDYYGPKHHRQRHH